MRQPLQRAITGQDAVVPTPMRESQAVQRSSRAGVKETKRNQITAYINRGSAYRATDDFDRAIADLDKAVQLDPKSSLALTKRASIYHEKGRSRPSDRGL